MGRPAKTALAARTGRPSAMALRPRTERPQTTARSRATPRLACLPPTRSLPRPHTPEDRTDWCLSAPDIVHDNAHMSREGATGRVPRPARLRTADNVEGIGEKVFCLRAGSCD